MESFEVEPIRRVFTGKPLHEIDDRPGAIARHWIVLSIHPANVLGHGGFGLTLIECEIVKLTNNRFVLFRCVRHENPPKVLRSLRLSVYLDRPTPVLRSND